MKKAELNPPGLSIVPRAPMPQGGSGQILGGRTHFACRRHRLRQRPRIQGFEIRHAAMPSSAPDPTASALPSTYEAALQELEQLVARLESGQMPLDQLLAGYQRGAALLALCKDKLQAVEAQIQVLDGGQPKPWTGA